MHATAIVLKNSVCCGCEITIITCAALREHVCVRTYCIDLRLINRYVVRALPRASNTSSELDQLPECLNHTQAAKLKPSSNLNILFQQTDILSDQLPDMWRVADVYASTPHF